MQSSQDIEKAAMLAEFKQTREYSDWVIPLKLHPRDDRDWKITRGEIYGIRKCDVLDGFDYEKASIGKPLAKLIFLRLIDKFNYLNNKRGYNWTVFDNLDRNYCLIMAVHLENQIARMGFNPEQPFGNEVSQFLRIPETRNVTDEDGANQWRMNMRRRREGILARVEGGGREELPRNLLRLSEVANYIGPYVNAIKSMKEFLRIIKTKPISDEESHLFRTPICRVDSMALEYRYSLDVVRTAIFNDNAEGREAMTRLVEGPKELQSMIFQGNGFRMAPMSQHSVREQQSPAIQPKREEEEEQLAEINRREAMRLMGETNEKRGPEPNRYKSKEWLEKMEQCRLIFEVRDSPAQKNKYQMTSPWLNEKNLEQSEQSSAIQEEKQGYPAPENIMNLTEGQRKKSVSEPNSAKEKASTNNNQVI